MEKYRGFLIEKNEYNKLNFRYEAHDPDHVHFEGSCLTSDSIEDLKIQIDDWHEEQLEEEIKQLKAENSALRARVEGRIAERQKLSTGVFDKNGEEVIEGDTIAIPYYYPDGSTLGQIDFKAKVMFFMGAFGYHTKTEFVPLFEHQIIEKGDYVPNKGNKNIYTGKFLFWVIDK